MWDSAAVRDQSDANAGEGPTGVLSKLQHLSHVKPGHCLLFENSAQTEGGGSKNRQYAGNIGCLVTL